MLIANAWRNLKIQSHLKPHSFYIFELQDPISNPQFIPLGIKNTCGLHFGLIDPQVECKVKVEHVEGPQHIL